MNHSPRFLTISWIALAAAIIVPPVGIVLGIVAAVKSRKLPNRPGNKAVAFSSIGAGAIMSFMVGSMLLSFLMYRSQAKQMNMEYMMMQEQEMMLKAEIEAEMENERMRMEQEAMKAIQEAEKALLEAQQAQQELNRIAPPNID